mmetsp:Transcript_84210/g.146226  ORF Transcript_84210/g.146226 Transcript_84210/m.146226 type:complete len:513 (-) Transcript_84210:48-1586(-)
MVTNGAGSEVRTSELWSVERGCFLCELGEEEEFAGKAVLLDSSFSSASQAVEQLNRDDSRLCPHGLCVLFSTLDQMYFLLFRKDRRKMAIALFGLTERPREEMNQPPEQVPTAAQDNAAPQSPPTSAPMSQAPAGNASASDAPPVDAPAPAAPEPAAPVDGAKVNTNWQDHPWVSPPWVSEERQAERIVRYGLDGPTVKAFKDSAEFISLGAFCGVAFTLQALGLRKNSYPFDWLRAPAEGVLQCVQTDFADFFQYTFCKDVDNARLYGGCPWGGSFWHHNPDDPDVQQHFRRRIDRLLGRRKEVPASMPRVFIRVCNSTSELTSLLHLRNALLEWLPQAEVYFLVIIDLQQIKGPLQLAGADDLLFYQVHASLWADPTAHFAKQMEANTEAYCEAVSCALRVWAGEPDARAAVVRIQNMRDLEAVCEPFEAGNTDSQLFQPVRVEYNGYYGRLPALGEGMSSLPGSHDPSAAAMAGAIMTPAGLLPAAAPSPACEVMPCTRPIHATGPPLF